MTTDRAGADVVRLLRSYVFRVHSELELQDAIEEAFRRAGLPARREKHVARGDRPDFLVGRAAIEVKIAGATEAVLRQLTRYAASDDVDELVLVTRRSQHAVLPRTVGGKPLHVAVLRLGAFG